jgi:hypothetical protein
VGHLGKAGALALQDDPTGGVEAMVEKDSTFASVFVELGAGSGFLSLALRYGSLRCRRSTFFLVDRSTPPQRRGDMRMVDKSHGTACLPSWTYTHVVYFVPSVLWSEGKHGHVIHGYVRPFSARPLKTSTSTREGKTRQDKTAQQEKTRQVNTTQHNTTQANTAQRKTKTAQDKTRQDKIRARQDQDKTTTKQRQDKAKDRNMTRNMTRNKTSQEKTPSVSSIVFDANATLRQMQEGALSVSNVISPTVSCLDLGSPLPLKQRYCIAFGQPCRQ